MARLEQELSPEAVCKPVRTALLGHRGAVLWLTGLSGSGKTTLARMLEQKLLQLGLLSAVLDGDELRQDLNQGLGFSPEDRRENIRRTAAVALHLAEAGVVVIVAHLSPFQDSRGLSAGHIRARGVPFAEVFVNAPLEVCEQRDPKGLYRQARAGKITSFTGIDSPYEVPAEPDLEVRTDIESIADSVDKIIPLALKLADSEG